MEAMVNWKKEILSIPNLLSLFRLVLIPIYASIYLNAQSPMDYYLAAAILAVSVLTDFLDGKIARRYHMITNLGKVLDPVADKATQGILMFCLCTHFKPVWLLVALFIVKEGFMAVMGLLNLRKGRMIDGAVMAGKVCTTVLFAALLALILVPQMHPAAVWALVFVCAVFMVISLVAYARLYYHGEKMQDLRS